MNNFFIVEIIIRDFVILLLHCSFLFTIFLCGS